jgi:glutamyl-tRNA synthetase
VLSPAPRVRFAPSPTGYLHIGGARTALFNWLHARGNGGVFVLRIEDTDAERSSWPMVEGILEGLRWLGLDWDEGPDVGGPHAPYFQSQRLDRHRALAEALVANGRAYYCYCSPDSIKAQREEAERRGETWRYDRRCLTLDPRKIAEFEAIGAARAVRFRVMEGKTRFDDLVHGPIEFDHAHLEDFVLLRSDGQPTYQLSVVADDIDMRITDVIRGDDHISNTPKQLLIYRALEAPVPRFAHVPLILGADRKRLSKRHGATSVTEYRERGYLPEAMVNFLALLGWSPGDDREVFTAEELTKVFSLEGISGGNAVFNPEKLDWFNAQHIARLPLDEIARRVRADLETAGLWRESLADGEHVWFERVLSLVRPRVKKLADFVEQARPFLANEVEYEPEAVQKYLGITNLHEHVRALGATLAGTNPFDEPTIERDLRTVADAGGMKAGALIHAARTAVTGRAVSPGLFEVLALLGRERVVARLAALERFLASPEAAHTD